jgi:hypothetical protein
MHVRLDFLIGSANEQEKAQTMVKTGQQTLRSRTARELEFGTARRQSVRTVAGDQRDVMGWWLAVQRASA